MKEFVLKVISFSILVFASVLFVFSLADGTTDAMYLKFTTPKQSALIIGSSRAAQGIQPKYLNKVLERNDIYNYAFQIPSSPYGEIYFESIKKKVDKTTKNGLFILEVNPWTLSSTIDLSTQKSYLLEKGGFIEKTNNVSSNPNVEYLLESLGKKYSDIIRNRNRKGSDLTYLVENDGWLHVTLISNSSTKAKSIEIKLDKYRDKLQVYKGISSYRMKYLNSTILFLKQYGTVYLVRVPIIKGLLEIENELQSDFDSIINDITLKNKLHYINMMPDNKEYNYTDGNHLDVPSGKKLSLQLADKIKLLELL